MFEPWRYQVADQRGDLALHLAGGPLYSGEGEKLLRMIATHESLLDYNITGAAVPESYSVACKQLVLEA